jgi:uncharacterized protein
MIFNVAQLMKSPVGTSLEYELEEENVQLDTDLKLIGPITGHARLRRINQGLLADGWVDVTLEQECTRCLKQFELPTHVPFEGRFYPTMDIVTGAPLLPPDDGEDAFAIDDHHQIDLTEIVRQHVLLEMPMVTLCKEDCAGLCSQCGKDLNEGPCNCQPEIDTRMSILQTLLQQQEEETKHTSK